MGHDSGQHPETVTPTLKTTDGQADTVAEPATHPDAGVPLHLGAIAAMQTWIAPSDPPQLKTQKHRRSPMHQILVTEPLDPDREAELAELAAADPTGGWRAGPRDTHQRDQGDAEDVARWLAAQRDLQIGDPPPQTQQDLQLPPWADELHQWWLQNADHDIAGSLAKIVEYGGRGAAYDLIATGHDLAAIRGRQVDDQEAIEMAIAFYISSKVNRWMAAIIDGRRPSDDTLKDIVYYGMMARRNRDVGGWPVKAI